MLKVGDIVRVYQECLKDPIFVKVSHVSSGYYDYEYTGEACLSGRLVYFYETKYGLFEEYVT